MVKNNEQHKDSIEFVALSLIIECYTATFMHGDNSILPLFTFIKTNKE